MKSVKPSTHPGRRALSEEKLQDRLPAPPQLKGFEGTKRFWDAQARIWIAQILPGEFYVSGGREWIATVLGSCISVCVRDPGLQIGGMNHFMLPGDGNGKGGDGTSLRFGYFAVERLLNELLKRGARRERLEVKIFGGGHVIGGMSSTVGASNIKFAEDYFATEGMEIVAKDVGGACGRKVRFDPRSGKVWIMELPMRQAMEIGRAETTFEKKLRATKEETDVELF